MQAIIIGKGLGKGVFAIRGQGGLSVCFVELKPGYKTGDSFKLDGVAKVLTLLHFKDAESIERLIKVLEDAKDTIPEPKPKAKRKKNGKKGGKMGD